jgi:hypothetical protein
VSLLLYVKGYSEKQVAIYIKAFDYFWKHPDEYDGATLVKDLMDIPGIDLDAMLHDYHYCNYNAGVNLSMKWKADWLIAIGGERKGKGSYSSFSKFVGLTLTTIIFTPYSRFKRGKATEAQKLQFLQDYDTLISKN